MATASRNVRKVRRLKREKSLAFRALREMNANFEALRSYAQSLRKEIEDSKLPAKAFTITKLDEPEAPILAENAGVEVVG